MDRANWHTYQILTKRSSLMRNFPRRRYDSSCAPMHMWFGVSVEDRLNKEVNAALADLKMKARLADLGTVLPGSPADFGKLIAEETEKWGKMVNFADMKPE